MNTTNKKMVAVMILTLTTLVSGCCRLMPDWVARNVGSMCMPEADEDCPEVNRHEGYCVPDECIYWACDCDANNAPTECYRVYECEETAADDGSRRLEPLCPPVDECPAALLMNDGSCCAEGLVPTWVQDEPNMEMFQVCAPAVVESDDEAGALDSQ